MSQNIIVKIVWKIRRERITDKYYYMRAFYKSDTNKRYILSYI